MTSEGPHQALIDEAYDALTTDQNERALDLGKKLLELKHVRGFEIVALALEQMGRTDEAIAALQTGLSKVPDSFPLWELLGNLLSDQNRFQESYDAYQRALGCSAADKDSISYNAAVMMRKAGQSAQALQLCEQISSTDLGIRTKALRASLLNNLNRHEEAGQLAGAVVSEILALPELAEEEMQDLATAYAELGRALWQGRQDANAAWENAFRALEWERSEVSALWLIRELVSRRSQTSRWYRLTISGVWHFPLEPNQPPPGFNTVYDVVAENVEDALQFARNLEPPEIRDSLRPAAIEDRGSYADHLQGIYWRGPYEFFDTSAQVQQQ